MPTAQDRGVPTPSGSADGAVGLSGSADSPCVEPKSQSVEHCEAEFSVGEVESESVEREEANVCEEGIVFLFLFVQVLIFTRDRSRVRPVKRLGALRCGSF